MAGAARSAAGLNTKGDLDRSRSTAVKITLCIQSSGTPRGTRQIEYRSGSPFISGRAVLSDVFGRYSEYRVPLEITIHIRPSGTHTPFSNI